MEVSELNSILKSTGYPVAYTVFKTTPKPPFIVFIETGTDNFFADTKTYKKISAWRVELYTNKKDLNAEKKVEAALADLCWNKSETYINDENVFENIYEFETVEVINNG